MNKERILVVGGGGREMALILTLLKSKIADTIIAAPGSDAIAELVPCHAVSADDLDGLVALSQKEDITLVIIGPEAPLALGLSDRLQKIGVDVFGPSQRAARIESSKTYAKNLMHKAGVPTAAHQVYKDKETAKTALSEVNYPIVLKENGLRAGKGVSICHTKEEALEVCENLELTEDNSLLFEEFLEGYEFSLIVMASGQNYIPLPIAQDYKAIFDGQQGPNTGGMGAVSPVPKVTPEIYQDALDTVIEPILKALSDDDSAFTGFLYAGLMMTASGLKVIEFNARLGDPESEVFLPRIEGDLVQAIRQLITANKTISCGLIQPTTLKIKGNYSLGVVLSSPGYPGKVTHYVPLKPDFFAKAEDAGLSVVHMGTRKVEDAKDAEKSEAAKSYISSGGRVLILLAEGTDIEDCRAQIYNFLEQEKALIGDLHYRTDIGINAM